MPAQGRASRSQGSAAGSRAKARGRSGARREDSGRARSGARQADSGKARSGARQAAGRRDPRVDAYIARAAPFAQPILVHLRESFERASDGLVEQLKWGHPSYCRHGIVCGFAAFKAHVSWGFWLHRQLTDPQGLLRPEGNEGMGGARVTSIADLPPQRAINAWMKEALALDLARAEAARERRRSGKAADGGAARRRRAARPVVVPPELARALAQRAHAAARKTFAALAPSQQRDYADWIAEARRDETRARRLATTLEWLAEGKPRHWKYMPAKSARR